MTVTSSPAHPPPPSDSDRHIRISSTLFDLSDPVFQDINRNSRRVAAGASFLQEGDTCSCVVIVRDGWLSTTKSLENGEVQLIDFLLPGDILEPMTADGRTTGLNVEALTDAVVAIIQLPKWHAMLKETPSLERTFEQMQAAERTRMSERMLRLGKGSAQTRIAYSLLELCVRLRAIGKADDNAFHVPLTQNHIGEFTGLSSVHVCRTMRRFVRNRIIETSDHMDIRIIDPNLLSEIAGIDADQLALEITSTRHSNPC